MRPSVFSSLPQKYPAAGSPRALFASLHKVVFIAGPVQDIQLAVIQLKDFPYILDAGSRRYRDHFRLCPSRQIYLDCSPVLLQCIGKPVIHYRIPVHAIQVVQSDRLRPVSVGIVYIKLCKRLTAG